MLRDKDAKTHCGVDKVKRENLFHLWLLTSTKARRLAFTLSEVLITLGIIGVVAAITISNLISNSSEMQYITALKKSYSTLSNAYSAAISKNGSPEYWIDYSDPVNWSAGGRINTVFDTLTEDIKFAKKCGTSAGCMASSYKTLTNNTGLNIDSSSSYVKAVLADGSSVAYSLLDPGCSVDQINSNEPTLNKVCGDIIVDVNGAKQPNKFGVDTFAFYHARRGPIPRGMKNDNWGMISACNSLQTNNNTNGFACTAWALQNQNMDYSKCSVAMGEISWDGPSKCP